MSDWRSESRAQFYCSFCECIHVYIYYSFLFYFSFLFSYLASYFLFRLLTYFKITMSMDTLNTNIESFTNNRPFRYIENEIEGPIARPISQETAKAKAKIETIRWGHHPCRCNCCFRQQQIFANSVSLFDMKY